MSFQHNIDQWMKDCFGPEISSNTKERTYRFFEEACELVQSLEMSKLEAVQLLDYVYDRPVEEDVEKEIGGVLVTLSALCSSLKLSMMEAGRRELNRCWRNIERIQRKHAAKKLRTPLPGEIEE